MAHVGDDRQITRDAEEILHAHSTIAEATRCLGTARDLVDLLQRIEELRALLRPHFGNEEAPGGFFDVLRSRAPRHVARVEQLLREHQDFLGEMERLERSAQACLTGPVASILRLAGDLARRLGDHETRENELLTDAMYTDSGYGD